MADDLLNKIYKKVEQISEDVSELKVTAAVQSEIANRHEDTLQTHVKRSDNLEALYNELKKEELEPLKADLYQLKGIYKFFLFLGVLGTVVTAILGLLKYFGH